MGGEFAEASWLRAGVASRAAFSLGPPSLTGMTTGEGRLF